MQDKMIELPVARTNGLDTKLPDILVKAQPENLGVPNPLSIGIKDDSNFVIGQGTKRTLDKIIKREGDFAPDGVVATSLGNSYEEYMPKFEEDHKRQIAEIVEQQDNVEKMRNKMTSEVLQVLDEKRVSGEISNSQVLSKLAKLYARSGEYLSLGDIANYCQDKLGDKDLMEDFLQVAIEKTIKLRVYQPGTLTISGNAAVYRLYTFGYDEALVNYCDFTLDGSNAGTQAVINGVQAGRESLVRWQESFQNRMEK